MPPSAPLRAAGASPEVNVVLGGGGAKGFAHVGVLAEVVARGYRIERLVGTSVGALVGGLFAYNRAVGRSSATRSRSSCGAWRRRPWRASPTTSGGGSSSSAPA